MRWSFALVVACVVALAGCSANSGTANGGNSGNAGAGGVDGGLDGSGAGGSGGSGASAGSAGAPNVPGPICFLTNCSSDAECHDCTFGRTHCDTTSNHCVACNSGTGQGCAAGQTCTKYGTCAKTGATCPTDSQGNPTVTCSSNSDCAPCDTKHQICDTTSKKCVNCSPQDTSACSGNEYCAQDGSCKVKCPSTCATDADCGQCTSGTTAAHACDAKTHTCAECSATTPCPSGKVCSPQGVCVVTCGMPDQPAGTCASDADCQYCGAQATACIKPINGGNGRCGVPATGCSDLGKNVTALPDPWSSITNTCSSDADCSGVGLNLNVGKLLRDATGLSSSLIHDATFQYPMSSCASISVGLAGKNYSCGLCVPCKTDADCKPIQVDPLVSQMFPGGLTSIAAKWALDKLYGSKDHVINMYCQSVAGNYGVCAPCSDPTSVCGVASTAGDGCQNVWQCAAGETCVSGKCQAAAPDCYGGTEKCTNGTVCAWNGDKYCCRTPGTGTQSCVNDSDCTAPQICSQDAKGLFYCMDKASTCT